MFLENDSNSYKSTTTTDDRYQGASGGKQYKTYNVDSDMMHNPTNTDIEILIKNCKRRNLANSRDK